MILINFNLVFAQEKAVIHIKTELAGTVFLNDEQLDVLWSNGEKKIDITRPGVYKISIAYMDGKTEYATVKIDSLKVFEVKFTKAREIGSRGPAGGFIFYDKGSYDDGWRYLEAAPMDIPGKYPWGANIKITGLCGNSKKDTDLIIEQVGPGMYAALVAKKFQYNGYSDWFLPYQNELELMYLNLYIKGIGNFRSETYWGTCYFINNYYFYPACFDFKTGENLHRLFNNSCLVRPIRRF